MIIFIIGRVKTAFAMWWAAIITFNEVGKPFNDKIYWRLESTETVNLAERKNNS